jgi:structural maintenance of chromosome 1
MTPHFLICICLGTCSKATANILAVDERQSLETLTREEKTASRALAQLREKHQDLDQKRERLSEDVRVHSERKTEVNTFITCLSTDLWF